MAVSGSFEGDLINTSDLVSAAAHHGQRSDHRHIAGRDMELAGADRADAAMRAGGRGHPAVEIGNADGALDQRGHGIGIEHMRQIVIDPAQDRLGQAAGAQGEREAFLQPRVIIDMQALAHFGEESDYIAHRRLLQIAEQRGIAEHKVVDVLVRIGRAESRPAASLIFHGVLARLDDPAAGDDRDGVEIGLSIPPGRCPCCCAVAAQAIGWPPDSRAWFTARYDSDRRAQAAIAG